MCRHERGDEDGDGDEISLVNWVAIFFKYKKYIYIMAINNDNNDDGNGN